MNSVEYANRPYITHTDNPVEGYIYIRFRTFYVHLRCVKISTWQMFKVQIKAFPILVQILVQASGIIAQLKFCTEI